MKTTTPTPTVKPVHPLKEKEIKQIVEKRKEEIKKTYLPGELERKRQRALKVSIIFTIAVAIAAVNFVITGKIVSSLLFFLATSVAIFGYLIYRDKYNAAQRIIKIEEVFPDFIELMASNLRAGMTIDKAILISSRKEFAPLDEEILRLGKDIVTGKEITLALYEMGERIKSDKIKKTISLIVTGIVSGGNLSILLEETAINMRERSFVEKRASSSVLMYTIFVFFAVAIGAPVLFGLSSVLIKTITNILSSVPAIEPSYASRMPFAINQISITTTFINYFAIVYMLITSVLSSLVIGVVNKGDEKSGINYIIPLAIMSTALFFIVQVVLGGFISNFAP